MKYNMIKILMYSAFILLVPSLLLFCVAIYSAGITYENIKIICFNIFQSINNNLEETING